MSQTFTGTVISLKTPKTAKVRIISTELHPKYHVPYKWKKNIQTHYDQIVLQVGDEVIIKSSRPYSRTKKFSVVKKLTKLESK